MSQLAHQIANIPQTPDVSGSEEILTVGQPLSSSLLSGIANQQMPNLSEASPPKGATREYTDAEVRSLMMRALALQNAAKPTSATATDEFSFATHSRSQYDLSSLQQRVMEMGVSAENFLAAVLETDRKQIVADKLSSLAKDLGLDEKKNIQDIHLEAHLRKEVDKQISSITRLLNEIASSSEFPIKKVSSDGTITRIDIPQKVTFNERTMPLSMIFTFVKNLALFDFRDLRLYKANIYGGTSSPSLNELIAFCEVNNLAIESNNPEKYWQLKLKS